MRRLKGQIDRRTSDSRVTSIPAPSQSDSKLAAESGNLNFKESDLMREVEWHQQRLISVRQELEGLDALSARAVRMTLEPVKTDQARSTQAVLVNEWCATMVALEAAYIAAHPYLDKVALAEFHDRCMDATGDFVADEEDHP